LHASASFFWFIGSTLYSFEADCVVPSDAHAFAQGWDPAFLREHGCTKTVLKSIMGDAFCVPIAALLSTVYIMNPWSPWMGVQKA